MDRHGAHAGEAPAKGGLHFVGMGVSGGYQAARYGPSISPGTSSPEAWDAVWPLLTRLAAKDKPGRPCTARLGLGGCGHYVKMVHNGIEHGMMTALCEVWGIMGGCFGWSHEEVAGVLRRWDTDPDSPLRNNFLVEIGAEICRTRAPGDETRFVLDDICDKVVQDVCEAASEAVEPAPSPAQAQTAEGKLRVARWLRDATYATFLLCFVQGMHLIAAADDEHGWGLDYSDVMQLWRGGCIIQSDAIIDLLDCVYKSGNGKKVDKHNLLAHPTIAGELSKVMASFRELVVDAVRPDAYVPALSASLEYLKVLCVDEPAYQLPGGAARLLWESHV